MRGNAAASRHASYITNSYLLTSQDLAPYLEYRTQRWQACFSCGGGGRLLLQWHRVWLRQQVGRHAAVSHAAGV
jgi:hypothetical protein